MWFGYGAGTARSRGGGRAQRPDTQFAVHVSFLEIYNNVGYDLLDPSHDTGKLEDLP